MTSPLSTHDPIHEDGFFHRLHHQPKKFLNELLGVPAHIHHVAHHMANPPIERPQSQDEFRYVLQCLDIADDDAVIEEKFGYGVRTDPDGDRLVVTRLMSLDSPRDVDHLGRPEYWTSLHQPIGLMITIDGPGALQVSESQVTLRLRAGRIEEAIPVDSVPGVREWHRTLATELQRRVADIAPTKKGRFGGDMFMLVGAVWSQVLSGCVAKRHGGAFIILDPEKRDGNVRFNYRLEKPDLGETIVKFWLESSRENTRKQLITN